MSLQGKTVLITGGAVRVGRALSLAVARNGADVIIHYNRSQDQAKQLQVEIQGTGRTAHLLQADLSNPRRAAQLVTRALTFGPLFALVNNASLYEPLNLTNTNLENWECHLRTNLTAPFLLSQAFAKAIRPSEEGRIVNIQDSRPPRPGAEHLPYTISKAGLAALTRSLAIALAPHVTVNGLALGAILPPGDQSATDDILDRVPSARWANLKIVETS